MSYECPNCGSKELVVVQCTVIGIMPLEDDGFIFEGSTQDEIVKCKNCEHKNYIGNFVE
jgi:DNA-directed RNA polymerase subunit RPC12/RpoP